MFKKMTITAGTLAVIAVLAFVVFNISNTLSPQGITAADPTETQTQLVVIPSSTGENTPTATPTPKAAATLLQLGPENMISYANWSPDSSRIILRNDDDLMLYTIHRDGSGLSKLVDFEAYYARWSADSSTIQICTSSYNQPKGKVFSVSFDGSNLAELPNQEKVLASLNGNCDAARSPDGNTIAFAKNDGKGLYFIDANGENMHQVIGPDLSSVNILKWSTDEFGYSLLFSALDQANTGTMAGIYKAQIDSSGRMTKRNLVNALSADLFWKLSPDGQKIVSFSTSHPGALQLSNIDGSQATTITNLPVSDLFWSPDGAQIAFTSKVNGDLDVFVMNVDGSNMRYYLNQGTEEWIVSWSPDGLSLVFWSLPYVSLNPLHYGSPFHLYLIDIENLKPYDPAAVASCKAAPEPYVYTVVEGDTLASIAITFGIPIQNITALNNLGSQGAVSVGQQLRIPYPTPASTNVSVSYVVQAGDTLASIAAKYSVPVESIRAVNGLDENGTISIDQQLTIPLDCRGSQ